MPHSCLSGVVTVAEHANIKVFAQRLRHVGKDSFLYITVELHPVILGNRMHVDGWVSWVKHKSGVMFLLEITHHVEGNLKVSCTGVSKVRRKERDLGCNVNTAELHHPTYHTNEVLVE